MPSPTYLRLLTGRAVEALRAPMPADVGSLRPRQDDPSPMMPPDDDRPGLLEALAFCTLAGTTGVVVFLLVALVWHLLS